MVREPFADAKAVWSTKEPLLRPRRINFAVLKLTELVSFEEESFTSLVKDYPTEERQGSYKAKHGQNVRTTQQALAMNHTQNIRHPCAILEATSPVRERFLMSSPDAVSKSGSSNLRDQLAILRAATKSPNKHEHKLLPPKTDGQYIAECESMVRSRKSTISVHAKSEVEPTLNILVGEEAPAFTGGVEWPGWIF